MEILQKQLKLEIHEYYSTHLSLINALLPIKLTPKEVEVLALFMTFKGELANDRFGTTGKKIVRDKLKLSQPGLANYMKSLISKGFLKKINGGIQILPILQPEKEYQMYQFKLINIG